MKSILTGSEVENYGSEVLLKEISDADELYYFEKNARNKVKGTVCRKIKAK